MGRVFVPASIEVIQDVEGLGTELATLFADAKNELEVDKFTSGTGTNEPTGIITELSGTGREVSMATNSSFAVGDLYTTVEGLGARYRGNASWMMNQVHINDVHELGSDQYATWNGDLSVGQTGQILGRPVYENSSMGTTLDGNTNSSLVHGDFNAYQIVDRVGASVEMVNHLFATGNNRPTGQRGFFYFWRVGAESVNDTSFVLTVNPST
jgi:HK97 family phage major capsid protein